MIYRPEKHSLWDTTVFHDGERLHLFYIAGEGYPGHAVSEDGVRWETRESLDLHGPEGSWNEKGVICNCLVESGGTYSLIAGRACLRACLSGYARSQATHRPRGHGEF